MEGRLPVGRISRLFGSHGEVMVSLYDTFPFDKNIEEPLFVVIDSLAVPFFVDRFQRRGQSGAVMVFADIDNDIRAMEIIGKEFFINSTAGNQPDTTSGGGIYLDDMVGWKAVLDKDLTGKIVGFIEGDNPLFRVDVGGNEVFIPAVDEFISSFSKRKKEVRFYLPEGLLELYL